MVDFVLNGKPVSASFAADTPLLWVLRDEFGLKGTKYGCGIAQCGVCTVHIGGRAARACVTALENVTGQEVVTIEGLSADGTHPLQRAWDREQVPQCGYCQPGQIMQAAELLAGNPDPTPEQVSAHMQPILCRCMAYKRIHRAVLSGAALLRGEEENV